MEIYGNILTCPYQLGRTIYRIDQICLPVQGAQNGMELLTGLNYCATLGLENLMENVQVHDLMCYRATFDEWHTFKAPLVQLLNLLIT